MDLKMAKKVLIGVGLVCAAFLIVMVFIKYYPDSKVKKYGTSDEAFYLVNNAIEHIQKRGEEEAFPDLVNREGKFVKNDLYVWVIDFNGKMLTHIDKSLVGIDLFSLQDLDGKFLIREILGVVKTKGHGWIDYKWEHPITMRVVPKRTYCKMYGQGIACCGVYVFGKR